MKPPAERALARIDTTDTDACWLWPGSKDAHGYGRVSSPGKHGAPLLVHRVLYEWMVGPIPDGMELHHTCRVPSCCNPAHMEPVTHAENIRRGAGNGNREKVECPQGHPYDYVSPSGRRGCRRCISENGKRSYRRRKGLT